MNMAGLVAPWAVAKGAWGRVDPPRASRRWEAPPAWSGQTGPATVWSDLTGPTTASPGHNWGHTASCDRKEGNGIVGWMRVDACVDACVWAGCVGVTGRYAEWL